MAIKLKEASPSIFQSRKCKYINTYSLAVEILMVKIMRKNWREKEW